MKTNQILFSLLRTALMGQTIEPSLLENLDDSDWKRIYASARNQGVLAICFDGVMELPKELRPNRNIFINWALSTENIEKRYLCQQKSLILMDEKFAEMNIGFLLMKGFSIGKYYPKPEHRECGDIDIYMGSNYKKGNELFRKLGYDVKEDYYRHSHIVVNGVMVENHCMLSDTKIRKDNIRLENFLVSMANEAISLAKGGGVVYAPIDFSALFLNWHCEAHFMFEKIQLRHIYDWALFLKYEAKNINIELFRDIKSSSTFGKLADILTSISLDFLGLDEHFLPKILVDDARAVDMQLRNKVLNYILESPRTDKSGNVLALRIRVFLRTIKDGWKIRKIFGMSVSYVLWKRVMGVIKG